MFDELYKLKKFKLGLEEILQQHLFEFDTTEIRSMINMKYNNLLDVYKIEGGTMNADSSGNIDDVIKDLDLRIEILERNNKIDNILKDENHI